METYNEKSNEHSNPAETGKEPSAKNDFSPETDKCNGTKSAMQDTSRVVISNTGIKINEKPTAKTILNSSKEDDNSPNEDDVPQDFFDDFSNPDFMEGLNIVDAWDDQPEGGEGDTDHGKKIVKEREKQSRSKTEDRKKRLRRSRSRDRKRNSRDRKQPPGLYKHSGKRRSIDVKKEKPKEDSDLRRDPAKTKRDLEKYKVKCDRDKEQKTITEKLRVVETGLVPPGTEMDVDIDEVLKKANQEKREKCIELDDSWHSHPNDKQSTNTVYPDLKPSPMFPSNVSCEPEKHSSKSTGKNRSSLEYAVMDDDPFVPEVRNAGVDYKQRSSSFQRSWHKNRSPHMDQLRQDSYTRRRKTPPFDRVHRVQSPMAVPSSYLDKKSPIHKSTSRGPVYGRRSLSREKKRRASRSRSRNRRSSSRVPFMRRRRSRSMSEREAWIRDPKRAWRRSRSRSRSRSPKRNRYAEKKEEKMPFLEEIRLLLNNSVPNSSAATSGREWPPNPHDSRTSHTIPIPTPVPVPPPNSAPSFQFSAQPHLLPTNASFDMYDQQFFIGDMPLQNPPMTIVSHPADSGPMVLLPGMSTIPPVTAMMTVPKPVITNAHPNLVPVPPPNLPLQIPSLPVKNTQGPVSAPIDASNMALDVLAKIRSLSSQAKLNSNEEAKKLYEEKKISLSDFLSMTTNLEDTSTATVNLPKKIQVISRCQDVMKQLEGGVLNGRFVVKRHTREQSSEVSNKSPLLGTPVKYKSTTPSTGMPKENFGKILTKLLSVSGVALNTVELADKEDIQILEHPPSPPAPPQISLKKPRNTQVTSSCPITPSKYLMKMVQTDPLRCKACEERSDIIYIHSASQCSVSVRTIATQTEDPVKDMLKNKSLASLTPAQLLMLKEKEMENHAQPAADDMRSSAMNHDRFGKVLYRDGRSPPARTGFSPPRTHFSPPRNAFSPSSRSHFSPPRTHFSPPRRYGSPPNHERSGIYVPTGPPILPKRHYPTDPFSGPNIRPPFTDSADRYFRR